MALARADSEPAKDQDLGLPAGDGMLLAGILPDGMQLGGLPPVGLPGGRTRHLLAQPCRKAAQSSSLVSPLSLLSLEEGWPTDF